MGIGKTEDTPQRLAAVAVWRVAPFFTDAERAALALAESITRIADETDRVPDTVWNEASRHYDEAALASVEGACDTACTALAPVRDDPEWAVASTTTAARQRWFATVGGRTSPRACTSIALGCAW